MPYKYGRMSSRLCKLAAAMTAGLSTAFVLSSCAPVDPVVGSAAGYALAAPAAASFGQIEVGFTVPKVTCARGENSSARIWAGLDGVSFARNPGVNAKAGLILACRDGTATYTPYYGIYFRGHNSPDQFFHLSGIKPGDTMSFLVYKGRPLPGQVQFLALVNSGRAPADNAQVVVTAPQIQGTSGECFVEAPHDPAQFTRFPTITIFGCDTGGALVRLNEQPGARLFNVTTKSGKVLTRTVNSGPLGSFSPFTVSRV
jgi:hypothetical protein